MEHDEKDRAVSDASQYSTLVPTINESSAECNNETPSSEQAETFSRSRDVSFILVICMAQALALAGVTQTVVTEGVIGAHFGVSQPGRLSWLTAAYSLTVGTFILPAGRLGDMYGHRLFFIVGYIWYGVWSMVAGVSVYSTFPLLAVSRAFQGIGPAILAPNALALVGRTYSSESQIRKKHMVFALFGASAPIGATLGAAFSAIFAQLSWWPWLFWTQAIVCICMAVLVYFIVPPDRAPRPIPEPIARALGNKQNGSEAANDIEASTVTFDTWGTVFGVCGLVAFNIAWNQAGVTGWSAAYNPVLLALGLVFFGAFLWIEARVASQPLVPIKHLSAKFGVALAVIALGWSSFGIWLYYSWRLLINLRGESLLLSVAHTLPVVVTGLAASLLTGFLLSRVPVIYILTAAMMCFLAGQILLGTDPLRQIYWGQTFFTYIVMPFGMDMSFPSGTAIVSASLPREHQGTGASLVNTVVNYSIAFGLGITGTIIPHVTDYSDGKQGLLKGYRGAWYFAIGLDAAGLVIAGSFATVEFLRRSRKRSRRRDEPGKGVDSSCEYETR